ncbi:hypothetical protein M426DRAFT_11075 [Hypoxylon sp. CI-4A]|nr:hypothetical protein M426DRAFT_11075 [Hypoxylon sp. CI-4A]
MNKTKDAIRDFIGKSGHHDTTVHESVEPAKQHERIKPTEHEEVNTAINKEVHQDHYHRTVVPVHDREVLPEQHQHKVGSVQHRDYDHRDHDITKRALAEENEKFKNHRAVEDTTHTKAHAPTVQGEHVHHHVHETIQPVVEKETIQPNVVHTIVPIHETHHNQAQHHSTTNLPPISMEEYKRKGGALSGEKERFDAFEGQPKTIHGTLETMHKKERGLEHPPDGVFHGDYDPLDGRGDHTVGAGSKTGRIAPGVNQGMSAQSSAQRDYRDAGRGTTTGTTAGTTSGLAGASTTAHPERHSVSSSTSSTKKENPATTLLLGMAAFEKGVS